MTPCAWVDFLIFLAIFDVPMECYIKRLIARLHVIFVRKFSFEYTFYNSNVTRLVFSIMEEPDIPRVSKFLDGFNIFMKKLETVYHEKEYPSI